MIQYDFFYKIYVMRRIDLQLDIIEVKGQNLFSKILWTKYKVLGRSEKKNLLNYFGSSNGIKKASIEDLEKVPNINKKTAEIIFNFFNGS